MFAWELNIFTKLAAPFLLLYSFLPAHAQKLDVTSEKPYYVAFRAGEMNAVAFDDTSKNTLKIKVGERSEEYTLPVNSKLAAYVINCERSIVEFDPNEIEKIARGRGKMPEEIHAELYRGSFRFHQTCNKILVIKNGKGKIERVMYYDTDTNSLRLIEPPDGAKNVRIFRIEAFN